MAKKKQQGPKRSLLGASYHQIPPRSGARGLTEDLPDDPSVNYERILGRRKTVDPEQS
ncbi:hypothetical protein THTE_0748 [Thermogutta terrifontis]|uniref:Uncharacterized protein n=1 Tax=Thermogutta terrifontis TaxID=1331910 RepID=A0A286RBL6_9BACT|nr:hypothetical protein THTE_0748 [Thermogutta terrifontis]